jgi:hypothetical protein
LTRLLTVTDNGTGNAQERSWKMTSMGLRSVGCQSRVTPLPMEADGGLVEPTADGAVLVHLADQGEAEVLPKVLWSLSQEADMPRAPLQGLLQGA